MHRKTVTVLLRIRAREHFVMSITKNHESHYVGVLDNPPLAKTSFQELPCKKTTKLKNEKGYSSIIYLFINLRTLFVRLSSNCQRSVQAADGKNPVPADIIGWQMKMLWAG